MRAEDLGEDSNTIGAVTGQLAGAVSSAPAIPKRWVDKLVRRDALLAMVAPLLAVRYRVPIGHPPSLPL